MQNNFSLTNPLSFQKDHVIRAQSHCGWHVLRLRWSQILKDKKAANLSNPSGSSHYVSLLHHISPVTSAEVNEVWEKGCLITGWLKNTSLAWRNGTLSDITMTSGLFDQSWVILSVPSTNHAAASFGGDVNEQNDVTGRRFRRKLRLRKGQGTMSVSPWRKMHLESINTTCIHKWDTTGHNFNGATCCSVNMHVHTQLDSSLRSSKALLLFRSEALIVSSCATHIQALFPSVY